MLNYQELINEAKKQGFSDFEITEYGSEIIEIQVYQGKVNEHTESKIKKVSLRAIYQNKMANLSIENLDANIDFVLNQLKENALILSTNEEYEIYEGSSSYPKVKVKENDFNQISIQDKIKLLIELETKLKQKDPRIIHVPSLDYEEVSTTHRIINSKNLDIEKQGKYCAVAIQIVAKEDEDVQSGYEVEVKERFDELDFDLMMDKITTRVLSMLKAKPVASKTYPVIIENEAMADLFSTFLSIFSGETKIKQITPLLNKENQKVMSDKITIIDDPMKEDCIFKDPFDDEGVACFKKEIVSKGVFKTFLHNLKTAKYFHTISTGNGFRTGGGIGVCGANTYISYGTKTKEEMISSLEEGLLITEFDGLHAGVNAISGDFSLKSSGYYIKQGKIVRPVTLIVVAGNFLDMMNDVDEVASDLKITLSRVGSPSILFHGLSVSGM